MLFSGLPPTQFTFGPILSSTTDPLVAAQIHPLALKTGLLHANPFTATSLIGFFARTEQLDDTLKLFEEMPNPTVVTWNSVISAFGRHGFVGDSVFLFRELLRTGIEMTECSFLSILSGLVSLDCALSLEQVHGLAIKTGIVSSIIVANALINGYAVCCGVYKAEKSFVCLPVKDVVSWSTVIAAFAKSGKPERAVEMFLVMSAEGVSGNESTFVCVLSACACLKGAECGELIHARTIKHGLSMGVPVGTSLIDFYAKCGRLKDARRVFNELPEKNIASWNALFSGYSSECAGGSLALVREMLCLGVRPNEISFSSGIKRASVSDLLQLHSLVIRMGYSGNDYVSSAIIGSYGGHGFVDDALACGEASVSSFSVVPANITASIYNKEGRYEEAQELLSQVEGRDTVSWNVLLTACARNGDYSEAFKLFNQMLATGYGYHFDNYTCVSLLCICSKINSFDMGTLLHGLIIKTNAGCRDVLVHNVLLDMYAKCGSLNGCLRIFGEMDERNLVSWTALISGLALHGCTREALERFKQMELDGFEPDRVAFLTVLTACRHGGHVEEGVSLFRRMSVYNVEPEMNHYICVVDLLCRFGHIKDAELVINDMPFQPNAVIWRVYLQGCKKYSNIHLEQ